jgi:hypothetical protein
MYARQFGIKVPPILFSLLESRVVDIRQCQEGFAQASNQET